MSVDNSPLFTFLYILESWQITNYILFVHSSTFDLQSVMNVQRWILWKVVFPALQLSHQMLNTFQKLLLALFEIYLFIGTVSFLIAKPYFANLLSEHPFVFCVNLQTFDFRPKQTVFVDCGLI